MCRVRLTPHQGLLELEAAVQADPTDHAAWYALGLKQQENEREDQAILALSKALQLSPDNRPTYLALAVSYTNEGDQAAANVMLEKWLDLAEGVTHKRLASAVTDELAKERQVLIERLINLARRDPEEVDPDIQIALGVLFNSSEVSSSSHNSCRKLIRYIQEYDKAEDCFQAALSVRSEVSLLSGRDCVILMGQLGLATLQPPWSDPRKQRPKQRGGIVLPQSTIPPSQLRSSPVSPVHHDSCTELKGVPDLTSA